MTNDEWAREKTEEICEKHDTDFCRTLNDAPLRLDIRTALQEAIARGEARLLDRLNNPDEAMRLVMRDICEAAWNKRSFRLADACRALAAELAKSKEGE